PNSRAVQVFNDIGVPVVGVFLDHPFQLRDRIDLPLARYHVSFPALHAARFCRTYIRDDITYHHLAHGTDVRLAKPWSERDISLIFIGSVFQQPEQQRAQWRDHGPDVERDLNDILDLVRGNLARPLEDSVVEVIGADNISFGRILPYMKTIDDFLRNAQRIECVQALSSLPLVVVGGGWEAFADHMPGVQFMGEKTIAQSLSLVDSSKAVLNPFPGYNDSHERVFNAMAGGSAALTNRSAYLEETFDETEIFFLANDAKGLAKSVGILIADDNRLAELATRGRTKMQAAHTWSARAGNIEEWIECSQPD
ncbi:MAG: glycosyltransferase family 1 protein, partial [Alphaproteobacteria bacterium]|nr:glycosyltransferase family 1 protein [Alphaproteobacteria bacterium]